MDERNYWLGFSAFSGIGPMKFKKLLAEFSSAKNAWQAPRPRLAKLLGEKITEKFDEFRNKFSIEDYLGKLKKKDVSFIILTDKEYPKLLSQIRNPPFLLYVKGDTTVFYSSRERSESRSGVIPDLIGNLDSRFHHKGTSFFEASRGNDKFSSRQDGYQTGEYHSVPPSPEPYGSGTVTRQARTITPTIAVVGTRRTTQYGREVTKILTEELVSNGFTIVSGLAMGVDAISHRTAIENNGSPLGEAGKTIAVLGCGVDCCYPKENQGIYNSIIESGSLIVSEYPIGQLPTKGSFPSRNRIIAGLSMGVLVTEGAEDSGSLITADYAIKFGRPVFAVPGPITSSMSKGPYKLISKGAKLVTTAKDILEELGVQEKSIKGGKSIKSIKGSNKEENMILEILQNEPLHFDEIARKTGFDSSKIGSILSVMEIKGLVKGLESGQFSTAS